MITLANLKTLLGITGTDQDDLLTSLLEVAIGAASDILKVDTIEEHTVEDEHIHLCNPSRMFLSCYPIDVDTVEMFHCGEKIENISFYQQNKKNKEVRFKNSDGKPTCLSKGHYTVNYTAGYTASNTPESLKRAIAMIVSSLLNDMENNGEKVKKWSIPDVQSVEYQSTYNPNKPYPPLVYTLLSSL